MNTFKNSTNKTLGGNFTIIHRQHVENLTSSEIHNIIKDYTNTINIASKLDSDIYLPFIYKDFGYFLYDIGCCDMAVVYFEQSIELFTKLSRNDGNTFTIPLAFVCFDLGKLYANMRNYSQSLVYLEKSYILFSIYKKSELKHLNILDMINTIKQYV